MNNTNTAEVITQAVLPSLICVSGRHQLSKSAAITGPGIIITIAQ